MNDDQVQQVGLAIERAGASVFVQLPGVGGGGPTVRIYSHNLADFIRNPEAAKARMLGVNVMQLRAWNIENGVPKCASSTKFGADCKNSVSPHTAVEPRAFADLHKQDYCYVHGG